MHRLFILFDSSGAEFYLYLIINLIEQNLATVIESCWINLHITEDLSTLLPKDGGQTSHLLISIQHLNNLVEFSEIPVIVFILAGGGYHDIISGVSWARSWPPAIFIDITDTAAACLDLFYSVNVLHHERSCSLLILSLQRLWVMIGWATWVFNWANHTNEIWITRRSPKLWVAFGLWVIVTTENFIE